MEYKETKIKEGIKLHTIHTDKFKTNLISLMLTTKMNKETVTQNGLIPAVLRRGCKTMSTQEEISKELEEMYGASSGCGIDKNGDNQVLKFYMETINDNFLPDNSENLLKKSIEKLLEIVFEPYLENGSFKKLYVEQEKENMKQNIEGRKDNKARYSIDRCIEEMYKEQPYGLYKYGNIEDLDKIDEKNLYQNYLKLLDTCKIDIFVSGIIDDSIKELVKENCNIQKLKDREADYYLPQIETVENVEENIVEESMEVTQGKLVLGLNVRIDDEKQKYHAMVYNTILGGSANSKLFQNVREKESLAYTASSNYYRFKNNIIINCGIEIENYDKALKIIKEQLEDMKNNQFSDQDVEDAKNGILSAIKKIDDEQDTQIIYYFGQELSKQKMNLEQYTELIQSVTREDILNIANNVYINTIYFLKNQEGEN